MMKLSMGIDVGNRNCFISCLSSAGEVVLEGKPLETNDESKWRDLLEGLSAEYRVHAAFEVGPHYEWLYDLLMEYCVDVQVINPLDFALIHRSRKKTDKIDSMKIAEGLHRDDLPVVYIPAKAVRADRRLVSFVHKSSQALSKVKGRLRSLLTPLRLQSPYKDILSPGSREWLTTDVMPRLEDQEQMFLRMLLDQGELLLQQRVELDRLVSERLSAYGEARYLESIPGFGPLTSLAVASAIGDFSRFARPDHLSGYFGVCGSVYQSGKVLRTGHMTKRGNIHVRWLLGQSLLHIHRKDPKARRRFQRLKRGKPTGVARGAQMRWLVEIVWHLLKKKEDYRITVKPRNAA